MQVVSSSQSHRVAFVTGGLKLGGATTFLLNMAGELVRRNIPTEIFSFREENPLAGDFAQSRIPIFVSCEKREIFEDRLKQILTELGRFRPTTVIANLGSDSFEVLRYVPTGIFRMGVVHADDAQVFAMVRRYVKVMDGVAVVSRTIHERLQIDPAFVNLPIHQLTLGVPMPGMNETVVPDSNRPLRILYLGRLDQEQKRVRLFPQIWSHLVQSGIPCQWTIAGDGPELDFLKTFLKNGSPHQVIQFLGRVGYAAVPGLLQQHDVFLLTSDYEGLPLSLVEAMGRGLVPVISDLESGVSEVVDASNGILVPVNEIDGYAKGVIHLHHHREELAAKSAAATVRVASNFSVTAMTDRWLAAFPPTSAKTVPWPKRWCIQAPLNVKNTLVFRPPIRIFRRLAKRIGLGN